MTGRVWADIANRIVDWILKTTLDESTHTKAVRVMYAKDRPKRG